MKKTGFIGLGIMGRPMAKHLVSAGIDLAVNDLDERAVADLVSCGARAASLKEIGETCDVILLCLP
ncbi:MAG: NAD(P)-binding domain-containing protein, partial [Firmicutes bacterium]|nr:NAD(P)-binding domain-containing protein [Bacillota bacterium]